MSANTEVFVVAATDRELVAGERWRTLRCGVGPVESAAATALALAERRPRVVLHVGVAGARRACGLAPLSIVIGSESRYCDLPGTLPAAWAARVVRPDESLVAAARRACPSAAVQPIGTSARVGGSSGCDVEAMEGFGVLRAAEIAGVAAIEVRVISNEIEDADRARWQLDDACALVTRIIPHLVAELESWSS